MTNTTDLGVMTEKVAALFLTTAVEAGVAAGHFKEADAPDNLRDILRQFDGLDFVEWLMDLEDRIAAQYEDIDLLDMETDDAMQSILATESVGLSQAEIEAFDAAIQRHIEAAARYISGA